MEVNALAPLLPVEDRGSLICPWGALAALPALQEPKVRIHLPPAGSLERNRFSWRTPIDKAAPEGAALCGSVWKKASCCAAVGRRRRAQREPYREAPG